MREKRKITGGIIGLVGFLLSPLSWWNDLFVNVPLAWGFAWVIAWFQPRFFTASFVIGYWATNVLGLVMLQKGAGMVRGAPKRPYGRKALLIDVGVSLFYTGVIVLLIHFGISKPVSEYLPKR